MLYEWTEFNSNGEYIQNRTSGINKKPLDKDTLYVEGNYDSSFFLKDGEVKKRPTMGLKIEGSIISSIPKGGVVWISNNSYEINDGVAEIGGYHGIIKIKCWPYLDEEIEI